MKKLATILFAAAILLAFLWSARGQSGADYQVIVHPSNDVSAVSKDEISRFLLKKKTRWDDGTAAAPIDLDSKSAVREAFSREVHGRSVSSIKNYWQRQIFSGREVPPPEVATDAEVVRFVSGTPGGIGYVSRNARLNGVKAITITG